MYYDNNLYYDIGSMLDETAPINININEFQADLATLRSQGNTNSMAMAKMLYTEEYIQYNGISEAEFEIIKSL